MAANQSPDKRSDFSATPLLTHAIEFRKRLMISLVAIAAGFALCYAFAGELYAFLVRPLAEASGGGGHRMIYTGLAEAFVTYIRLALWGGTFLAFPVILSQIWLFVAPGLYRQERRAFLPFLIATPLLFFVGAALAYYFIFPLAWQFFLSFEVPASASGEMPIQLEARVSEYLSLAMTLIMAFGLSFELPVLLVLLARIGVISPEKLVSFRRFAIVLIFVFAAIVTPPDVFSQIALALPMMALYEISIFGARWAHKQRGRSA